MVRRTKTLTLTVEFGLDGPGLVLALSHALAAGRRIETRADVVREATLFYREHGQTGGRRVVSPPIEYRGLAQERAERLYRELFK